MNHKQKVGLLAACLMLFLPMQGQAQSSGKISGKIIDAETGEPLPGANVVIQETTQGAAADLEGNYFIINVPPGSYTLAASIIGFSTVIQQEVRVVSNRTTTLDFSLQPAVFEGEEITVTAERPIVPPDVSQSQQVLDAETHIESQPVQSLEDLLNMQAGIENMVIRGGGQGQTRLMVDGFDLVDERRNTPVFTLNLNSIQEVEILTGGFNAEYGNIRSGMLNITTKDGTVNKYSGSIDFRVRPPTQKHFGEKYWERDWQIYAGDNSIEGNEYFAGWNKLVKGTGQSPEQAKALWEWQHRPVEYANKPDYLAEGSLSGPVPLLANVLPTSFFLSYRRNYETYVIPLALERDGVTDQNVQLKLSSRITPSINLSVFGLYNTLNTLRDGLARPGQRNDAGPMDVPGWEPAQYLYSMGYNALSDLSTSLLGMSFTHTLGNSTFYTLKAQRFFRKDNVYRQAERDTTARFEYYPGQFANEAPFGWYPSVERDQIGYYFIGQGGAARDNSRTTTYKFEGALTSQIDIHNQIKSGFELTLNRLDEESGLDKPWHNDEVMWYRWLREPVRAGAYIQDKIEWEGMVANVGVRMDYTNANVDWYTVDRFSPYFAAKNVERIDEAPTEPAKHHLAFSPRLGVSFPISENTKFFFNYGHFYSMPGNEALFAFQQGDQGTRRISRLGNPDLVMPRTVAYEVGYDQNLFDEILLHVAGYYKDVTNQPGLVGYHNRDYSVSYQTYENKNYEDIKGFEIRAEKKYGRFFWGWLNYNYVLVKNGFVGFANYYEDPRIKAQVEGAQQFKSVPQPTLRASIDLHTPPEWGKKWGNLRPFGGWAVSLLYSWQEGGRFTWEPKDPEERNNMQWVDYSNTTLRISKDFLPAGGMKMEFFATVNNLFNQKYLRRWAFHGSEWQEYLQSLKLPWYEGDQKGNDKVGIYDKDYLALDIRAPHLLFFNPRSVRFGIRANF